MVECAHGINYSSGSYPHGYRNSHGHLCLVLDSFGCDATCVGTEHHSHFSQRKQIISMSKLFEKWWETEGYFQAKKAGLLGDVPDAVEIARLAYERGLYTAPPSMESFGKSLNFPTHLIRCDCSGHMLECEVYNWQNGESGVNFSIWERGRNGKKIRSWREKFRWCWQILKTGMPWADDIIATNKEARGLAEFILQNVPKEQPNEETKNQ